MQYRRELDGLRAVAVMPVLFYHAGFKAFGGGYIGVDIFFVISGYLITSIIVTELEQGKFSILRFYERRARRILPMLYFVTLISIPMGWLYMLTDPLENFGQSILATTLFSNNILLLVTSNYWDIYVDFKPLVHTWSLAVEEQFYIFFPIFLILIFRFFQTKIPFILSGLFIASLALSEWGSTQAPQANFYLLPFRMWELLAGSICVFIQRKNLFSNKGALLSSAGLLLIILSVLTFDDKTPFPSIYALAPILGTSLIVLFGQSDGITNKILSHRSFVGIGLISYSAYLWHQPLFAFWRITSKHEPSAVHYSMLIVLTLFLSYLTWSWIEKPFRNQNFIGRRGIFTSAFSAGVFLSAIGLTFHLQHGFPSRVYSSNGVMTAGNYASYNQRAFEYKRDSFSTPDKVHLLVLGDSFARDFVNMISENLPLETLELIYRDDMVGCLNLDANSLASSLVSQSDVIVLASGDTREICVGNVKVLTNLEKQVFYAGTKHFGYNLNWLISVPPDKRPLTTNRLMKFTIQSDIAQRNAVPPENYIDIIGKISDGDGSILITDEQGRLLSMDRTHLTKHGALFVGKRVLNNSRFLRALNLPEDLF